MTDLERNLFMALRELVELKDMKDRNKGSKTEEYLIRQPLAWQAARQALIEVQDIMPCYDTP